MHTHNCVLYVCQMNIIIIEYYYRMTKHMFIHRQIHTGGGKVNAIHRWGRGGADSCNLITSISLFSSTSYTLATCTQSGINSIKKLILGGCKVHMSTSIATHRQVSLKAHTHTHNLKATCNIAPASQQECT